MRRDDWGVWLILAGRGFGKTRTLTEDTWEDVLVRNKRQIALIAPTARDIRKVLIEGPSGILNIGPKDYRPIYEPSLGHKITWPNGAVAYGYSADEPNRLRGPEHDAAKCLIGSTLISMADGSLKPISAVVRGDYVITRSGAKKVLRSWRTQQSAGVMSLRTMDGRDIIGTGEHLVWVNESGWTPIQQISRGQSVCVIGVSSGVGKLGMSSRTATTCGWFVCTGRFGKLPTDRLRKGLISTTGTITNSTTPSTTWNCSPVASTADRVAGRSLTPTKRKLFLHRLSKGKSIARSGSQKISHASNAGRSSIVGRSTQLVTAPANALKAIGAFRSLGNPGIVTTALNHTYQSAASRGIAQRDVTRWLRRPELGLFQKGKYNARSADPVSLVHGQTPDFAVEGAPWISTSKVESVSQLEERQDVYDLTIKDAHEFFANGVLVHNCDEIAAWQYLDEAWSNMMFGLRIGSNPDVVASTTPRPIKFLKDLVKAKDTVVTRGSSYDNKSNLSQKYYDRNIAKYEGTRLGRQEINAEILEDVEGALWTRGMLDNHRVVQRDVPPLVRIVVAIDPAVSALESSDETGIIIAGIAANGHCYVLEDRSGKYSPRDWVNQAVQGWAQYRADRIVAEVNNGGDLVEAAIRSFPGSGGCIPYTKVHASRGKRVRAEPVSALYERGRVHHVLPASQFEKLESQLCEWVPGVSDGSPDRLDSLCWAITELAITPTPLETRVISSGAERVSISRF